MIVALDAMGVIYRHGDDVAEVLVPYLRELGCPLDAAVIGEYYREASLGRCTSVEFWRRCAVPGDDEAYCARLELMPGIIDLLTALRADGARLACLSNDVSEWSRLLRHQFGLDAWIGTWVVSGDIGVRKPDPGAYAALLAAVDAHASAVHFLDDRPANVAAARQLGIDAHHFVSCEQARRHVLAPALDGGS